MLLSTYAKWLSSASDWNELEKLPARIKNGTELVQVTEERRLTTAVTPAGQSLDFYRQHHHAVRRQAAVRERFRQIRQRQPLRPDRRQRLRQVDLHENPRWGSGAVRRPGDARTQRAPGQAAPGSVRLREFQRHRYRDHGSRGVVEGQG